MTALPQVSRYSSKTRNYKEIQKECVKNLMLKYVCVYHILNLLKQRMVKRKLPQYCDPVSI